VHNYYSGKVAEHGWWVVVEDWEENSFGIICFSLLDPFFACRIGFVVLQA
jgi:hypothetical protein